MPRTAQTRTFHSWLKTCRGRRRHRKAWQWVCPWNQRRNRTLQPVSQCAGVGNALLATLATALVVNGWQTRGHVLFFFPVVFCDDTSDSAFFSFYFSTSLLLCFDMCAGRFEMAAAVVVVPRLCRVRDLWPRGRLGGAENANVICRVSRALLTSVHCVYVKRVLLETCTRASAFVSDLETRRDEVDRNLFVWNLFKLVRR